MDCKPFLPQVDFRHGVYHSNRKQARTRYSHVLSVLFKELRMYIQTAQHPRVLLKVMLEVTHVQGAALGVTLISIAGLPLKTSFQGLDRGVVSRSEIWASFCFD